MAPFQTSASGRRPWPTVGIQYPAASQASGDRHDTPDRLAMFAPAGYGVGWMAQVVPFQTSASGFTSPLPMPLPLVRLPVAVQAVADVHDTASSRLARIAPSGLGVGCTDQATPFQLSARVTHRSE